MTLADALRRTAELAEIAPPVVRAHHAVHVLFPVLAREIGVKAVGEQVGLFVRDVLARKLDLCSVCCVADVSDCRDGKWPVCPKCATELDDLAEMSAPFRNEYAPPPLTNPNDGT